MKRVYLLAEYCPGPFYMGWHLYLRDRNDGSPNDERWDGWGWLRMGGAYTELASLHAFLAALGHEGPFPERHREERFAEWFAGKFPGGLHLASSEDGWELVEIVPAIPTQARKGVIRTVKGANISFAAACRFDGKT